MRISLLSDPPAIDIDGFSFDFAPPAPHLLAHLGPPSRHFDGNGPAPVGHRNNQCYVYDALGFHLLEHHYTRRIDAITLWPDVREKTFGHTPISPFSGEFLIDGRVIPLSAPLKELGAHLPNPTKHVIGECFKLRFGPFPIHLTLHRPKLPSGHRSRTPYLAEIEVGIPHDPWLAPVGF